jgi:hypothetical protein
MALVVVAVGVSAVPMPFGEEATPAGGVDAFISAMKAHDTYRVRRLSHDPAAGTARPSRTVMEIVGHVTTEMTIQVYGHVSLDDKRAALDQLGDLLDGDDEL